MTKDIYKDFVIKAINYLLESGEVGALMDENDIENSINEIDYVIGN